MSSAFGVEIELRRLFESPTVEELGVMVEREVKERGGKKEGREGPALVRVSREGRLPLSYAQQRLWFLDQLTPGSTWYNMVGALRVHGPLDRGALKRSLEELVRRHEVLRTRFEAVEGEPWQVIEKELKLELPEIDLSGVAGEELEAETERRVQEEAGTAFDLKNGPLLRVKLLRQGEREHVLVVNMHHVVSDGWSVGVLVREVSAMYQAYSSGKESPLEELEIQYADYSAWQREWLVGEVLEEQLGYWKKELEGVGVLEIPTDRRRPPIPTQNGASVRLKLGGGLSRKIKEMAQREGVTLFMLLLAAYQSLLHRYGWQKDIAVGSPIAGRTRPEIENLIGFFVNTLVMRANFAGQPTFREVLQQVKERTLGAYAHQDVPFERLVDELQPDRGLGRTPLFQTMFILQNAPSAVLNLGMTQLEPFRIQSTTARFDLMLVLGESEEGLEGTLDYDTDMYEEETARGMGERLEILLEGIVEDAGRGVWEYGLLREEEREELVKGWRGEELGRFVSVVEGVRREAEREGGRVALVSEGEELSYGELEEESNRLGRYLRKQGVRRGERVGVCVGKGRSLVVGILGVLKAGGVVVGMESEEAEERKRRKVEEAGVRVVLTEEKLKGGMGWMEEEGRELVEMDVEKGKRAWREESEEREWEWEGVEEEELACLLYRSSPEGGEEGIGIVHGQLRVEEKGEGGGGEQESVGLGVGLWGESGSVELLRVLGRGGRVVNVGGRMAPRKKAGLLRDQGVTELWSGVGEVERLGREFPWALKKVKRVVCEGGVEELKQLGEGMRGEVGERVYGSYGSSEVGGSQVQWKVKGEEGEGGGGVGMRMEEVRAGTRMYLLDGMQEPVPEGVVGELYVGGGNLGWGYEGNGGRTGWSYVPDRVGGEEGERLYRTGDLWWRRRDGSLEYVGRKDGRVQLGGRRVEAGEVEYWLKQHEGLKEAVVTVRGEVSGQEEEMAVWAVRAEGAVGAGLMSVEVREYLRKKMGVERAPERITMVEQLRRKESGEVEVAELRRLLRGGEVEYVEARSEVEKRMAGIWKEILGVERVGVNDNFFQIGGHSLLATQVVARMSSAFGVEIELRRLFESPTISELAFVVESLLQQQQQGVEKPEAAAPIRRVDRQSVLLPQ